MAGAHILAAQGGQADFAGNTRPGGEVQPGAPAMPSPVETLSLSTIRSDLDHIVSGGFHPETLVSMVAAPANRALELVSSQFPGVHGGAVPRPGTVAQPGPAGESIAQRGRAILARLGVLNG